MRVTDMSHVRRMFVEAPRAPRRHEALRPARGRLHARSIPEDRRYLLYNPMVKMKVTTQGEAVIDLLWDAIAAKGFEKDMYFSQAAIDIRALPKLEGTVHVNIALIAKFMPNFFFNPGAYPEVGRQDHDRNDDFLFHQGSTRGLGQIQLPRLPACLRRRRSGELAASSSSRPGNSATCWRKRPPVPIR